MFSVDGLSWISDPLPEDDAPRCNRRAVHARPLVELRECPPSAGAATGWSNPLIGWNDHQRAWQQDLEGAQLVAANGEALLLSTGTLLDPRTGLMLAQLKVQPPLRAPAAITASFDLVVYLRSPRRRAQATGADRLVPRLGAKTGNRPSLAQRLAANAAADRRYGDR